MIILPIEPIWLDIAYSEPSTLNDKSVVDDVKPLGTIGELAVCSLFADSGADFKYVNHYDYDILLPNCRVDVKSSRSPDWISKADRAENGRALVSAYLEHSQKCDMYIFTCVDLKKDFDVSIMGWIPKSWFWETPDGEPYQLGQKVGDTTNEPTARLLKYKYLNQFG